MDTEVSTQGKNRDLSMIYRDISGYIGYYGENHGYFSDKIG